MTPSCGNCRFWRNDPAMSQYDGSCRRHAPGTANRGGAPCTDATYWCGEHEGEGELKMLPLEEEGPLIGDAARCSGCGAIGSIEEDSVDKKRWMI